MVTDSEYLTEETGFLLHTLCHEILEKLQFVSITVAFLQETYDEIGQTNDLNIILSNIREVSNLTQDIRRLTGIIGNIPQHSNYPPIDLKVMLQDVVNRVSNITNRQLNIEELVETDTILIRSSFGDVLYRALELMFGNLAVLTPEDDVLQISLNTTGKQASISIKGQGVKKFGNLSPAEAAQSLFQGTPSVGISIDFAKKIIEAHAGSLEFNQEFKQITLILPIAG
jgi:light-regulated signal transduction histidine kinase (bacteriophytochrome)